MDQQYPGARYNPFPRWVGDNRSRKTRPSKSRGSHKVPAAYHGRPNFNIPRQSSLHKQLSRGSVKHNQPGSGMNNLWLYPQNFDEMKKRTKQRHVQQLPRTNIFDDPDGRFLSTYRPMMATKPPVFTGYPTGPPPHPSGYVVSPPRLIQTLEGPSEDSTYARTIVPHSPQPPITSNGRYNFPARESVSQRNSNEPPAHITGLWRPGPPTGNSFSRGDQDPVYSVVNKEPPGQTFTLLPNGNEMQTVPNRSFDSSEFPSPDAIVNGLAVEHDPNGPNSRPFFGDTWGKEQGVGFPAQNYNQDGGPQDPVYDTAGDASLLSEGTSIGAPPPPPSPDSVPSEYRQMTVNLLDVGMLPDKEMYLAEATSDATTMSEYSVKAVGGPPEERTSLNLKSEPIEFLLGSPAADENKEMHVVAEEADIYPPRDKNDSQGEPPKAPEYSASIDHLCKDPRDCNIVPEKAVLYYDHPYDNGYTIKIGPDDTKETMVPLGEQKNDLPSVATQGVIMEDKITQSLNHTDAYSPGYYDNPQSIQTSGIREVEGFSDLDSSDYGYAVGIIPPGNRSSSREPLYSSEEADKISLTPSDTKGKNGAEPTGFVIDEDRGHQGIGCCGIILTGLSWFLIVLTWPISLCLCIKVVQEYERAVIFRLGRLMSGGAKGPGLFFIIPCMDSYTKVDMRTVSFDVPPQEVLSKDSVTVAVDAVVYYRVQNATISVTNVEDAARSTRLLAATNLRNVLGTKNLSEILADRENISHLMQKNLDEATDPWGVKVERVEIKDVRLPVQLQRAMAAEAEAAREARAKVIAAEGEHKAARALKNAADVINESPSALQLRYLQTLNTISAEKNSTIIFPLPIDFLRGFIESKNGS